MPTKTAHDWKVSQQHTKIRKKVRLALSVFAFLALLLILGQAARFKNSLYSPWRLQLPLTKDYLWNGQFNINLAILTNSISVLTFNPTESTITIVNLPPQTYLEVPKGFGYWQLRAIYNLGESEQKGGGGKFVKETLSQFLGIHLDGFLQFNASQRNAREIVEALRANPFSGIKLLSDLTTDLTLWEILKLKWAFWQVRFDKVQSLDILDLEVLDGKVLPDGTEVLTADPVKLDLYLSQFLDPEIREENLTIAVFNATNYPFLAQKAKRIIQNLGGRVIVTTNAQQSQQRTFILGADTKTKTRLVQIFDLGCSKDPKCDKIPPEDLGLAYMRSQISVVLGEDFFKWR